MNPAKGRRAQGGAIPLILIVILLLVLIGGYSVIGALLQIILVILVIGAVLWLFGIVSRGGHWW
jgi:hypothetical protein